ncbi:MAG: CapA family protein [Thermoplasmatota archaeon]
MLKGVLLSWIAMFLVVGSILIPSTSAEEGGQKLTIAMMGDIVFNSGLGSLTEIEGIEYPFEEIVPLIDDADITLANLESPISDKGSPEEGKSSPFRMDPWTVDSLKYAGIDAVSLSNNHCLDYGPEALNDTMDLLEKEGIGHTGIYFGKRIENATIPRPLLITAGDFRIGLLAYTEDVRSHWVANEHFPGPLPMNRKIMENDIRTARDHVDLLIISVHWRKWPQYTDRPEPGDIDICHDMVDWGADIIMGHGPHTVHQVEEYRGALILYSLGNVAMANGNRTSFYSYIAKVNIVDGRIDGLELVPIYRKSFRYIPMGTPIERSSAKGYNITREEIFRMYDKDIYGRVDDELSKNDIRILLAISPWYLKALLVLLLVAIVFMLVLISRSALERMSSRR